MATTFEAVANSILHSKQTLTLCRALDFDNDLEIHHDEYCGTSVWMKEDKKYLIEFDLSFSRLFPSINPIAIELTFVHFGKKIVQKLEICCSHYSETVTFKGSTVFDARKGLLNNESSPLNDTQIRLCIQLVSPDSARVTRGKITISEAI